MKSRVVERVSRGIALVAVISLSAFFGTAAADEPEQILAEPGFRPHSEYAFEFAQSWDNATIAVLPTIVRRESRTAHSFASQQQIIALLETHGATPVGRNYRLDFGPLRHRSQWNAFEHGLATTAQSLLERGLDTDYTLVVELLSPMEGMFFGIEIYILDQEGRNAFSFLLNAHHQLFADANLLNQVSSEEARESMTERATAAAMAALFQQIDRARDCAAQMAALDIEVTAAGILHDFESELVTASDEHGIRRREYLRERCRRDVDPNGLEHARRDELLAVRQQYGRRLVRGYPRQSQSMLDPRRCGALHPHSCRRLFRLAAGHNPVRGYGPKRNLQWGAQRRSRTVDRSRVGIRCCQCRRGSHLLH